MVVKNDKVKLIKLRRQLVEERQKQLTLLEKLKTIKIHDEWISETNKGIAAINTVIRKSNNWVEAGDKFGIKLSKSVDVL